ncbi:hypothetical protein CsSME_00050141 [Camellia sinensis var. sinensis]
MSSFFSYKSIPFFFLLFLFLSLPPRFPARTLPELTVVDSRNNNTWRHFVKFLDAGKGSHVTGMSELKKYFQRFGYLDTVPETSLTDTFDDRFESAVITYQKNLGLAVTGKLDTDTVTQIISPRCGVSDDAAPAPHKLHVSRHYAYFHGQPRWARSSPMTLTYAFSPVNIIHYVSQSDLKAVFERAFSRWSAVIPVNFTEANNYWAADIKIGFYHGDHGDGEAFDGVLGILAHAFSPENGRFHLDAAETWAVDFGSEKSKVAVDLESVVTHEIGHILGLAHSSVKQAVMYPSLSPRTKKVDLRLDDVEGVQSLYGSNPNFKFSSLLASDTSISVGAWMRAVSVASPQCSSFCKDDIVPELVFKELQSSLSGYTLPYLSRPVICFLLFDYGMEIHDSLFEDIELRCVGVYAERIDVEGRYTESFAVFHLQL